MNKHVMILGEEFKYSYGADKLREKLESFFMISKLMGFTAESYVGEFFSGDYFCIKTKNENTVIDIEIKYKKEENEIEVLSFCFHREADENNEGVCVGRGEKILETVDSLIELL